MKRYGNPMGSFGKPGSWIALLFFSFLLSACNDAIVEKIPDRANYFYPAKEDGIEVLNRQTVYVPVYSHIYTSNGIFNPMGITLSIRNTDFEKEMLVEQVLYYDTEGKLVETYVSTPHVLKAMGSVDFVVDTSDMRGGAGANFIVTWASTEEVSTPIIQAVMVNNAGTKAFAFITEGQATR